MNDNQKNFGKKILRELKMCSIAFLGGAAGVFFKLPLLILGFKVPPSPPPPDKPSGRPANIHQGGRDDK